MLPQRRRKSVDIEPESGADSLLDRRDIVAIVGILIICVSVGLISAPAGGILFGIILVAGAFLL